MTHLLRRLVKEKLGDIQQRTQCLPLPGSWGCRLNRGGRTVLGGPSHFVFCSFTRKQPCVPWVAWMSPAEVMLRVGLGAGGSVQLLCYRWQQDS